MAIPNDKKYLTLAISGLDRRQSFYQTAVMSKKSVTSIIEGLGAENIAAGLGVSDHSIRYARTNGSMPASWYRFISAACLERGIPCPLDAFSFKESHNEGRAS
jgi:hypothetical protein